MNLDWIICSLLGGFVGFMLASILAMAGRDKIIADVLRASARFCGSLPTATGKELAQGLEKQAKDIEG